MWQLREGKIKVMRPASFYSCWFCLSIKRPRRYHTSQHLPEVIRRHNCLQKFWDS